MIQRCYHKRGNKLRAFSQRLVCWIVALANTAEVSECFMSVDLSSTGIVHTFLHVASCAHFILNEIDFIPKK